MLRLARPGRVRGPGSGSAGNLAPARLDALPVELVLLYPITAAKMVLRMNAERRARATASEEDAPTAMVRPAP